ncbi:MAG: hypothetical protein NWR83_13750, partial [Salibacteraceae bacterium]|nr:hypothetical protein [Salibacteraceae bacterium]
MLIAFGALTNLGSTTELLVQANSAIDNNDFETAKELFLSAFSNDKFRLKAGLKLLWLCRSKNLEIDFSTIITRLKCDFPNEAYVWMESARLNKIAGDFAQAFEDSKKAIELKPSILGAYQLLMSSSFVLNKTHETKEILDKKYPLLKNEEYFLKVYLSFYKSFKGEPGNLEIIDRIICDGGKGASDSDLISALRNNLDYLFQVKSNGKKLK